MSKWGIEEVETLRALDKIDLSGDILNLAAGDGRFNNKILESANRVVAIDIDSNELQILQNNCPKEFRNKLDVRTVDITKNFPFVDESFDGVFCTGTLHLFDRKILMGILQEVKRVLKKHGKIVLDFATNIERFDKDGEKVIFSGEGCYSTEDAVQFFKKELKDFVIHIESSTFSEENLSDCAGYQVIKGDFLVISGYKNNENEKRRFENES